MPASRSVGVRAGPLPSFVSVVPGAAVFVLVETALAE